MKVVKASQEGIVTSTVTESPTSTEFPFPPVSSTVPSEEKPRPKSMPVPPRKFSAANPSKGPEVTFEQIAPVLNEAKKLHDKVKELKDKVNELAEKNRRKSIELRDLVSPGEATTT